MESNTLQIDYLELLTRIILSCKNHAEKDESKSQILASVDVISAAYYYRRYPNVDDFITRYLKKNNDYFQIQWVRSRWAEFQKMTQTELSNLVINEISLVAKLEEDE